MARKRKRGEAPTCNCLLLCEDVLTNASGKHFLHGVIGLIRLPSFPAQIGGFVAYLRLSNVYEGQEITLDFVDAANDDILITATLGFPSQANPLGVYTLVTKVPMFTVPTPGRYMFNVNHNGVPFAQSPVEIQVLGGPTS